MLEVKHLLKQLLNAIFVIHTRIPNLKIYRPSRVYLQSKNIKVKNKLLVNMPWHGLFGESICWLLGAFYGLHTGVEGMILNLAKGTVY